MITPLLINIYNAKISIHYIYQCNTMEAQSQLMELMVILYIFLRFAGAPHKFC